MSAATREALDCVRILRGGEDAAREAAVARLVVLGQLADQVVFDALRDPSLVESVLRGLRSVLGRTASDRYAEPLVAILLDERYASPSVHWSARVVAAQVLGLVGGARAGEALVRVVTRFVETREKDLWSVAWRAIEALGRFAFAPAAPVLVQALAHPDHEIDGAACSALVRIGAPAVPALLSLYRYAPEERESALWILATIGDPRAADVAFDAVADRSNPVSIRAYGALAVGSSRADGAFEILLALVDDEAEDARVRSLGIEGLGRLGDRRAFPKLLAAMRGDRESERLSAIAALGLLGDGRAAPGLIGLLGSHEFRVVREAVRALGRLGDPRGLSALRAIGAIARAYAEGSPAPPSSRLPSAARLHASLLAPDRARAVAHHVARALARLEALGAPAEASPRERT